MASTDAYVTTKVPSHLPYLNQFCNVAITMLYVIIIYFTSQLIYCSLFVKQSMMVRSLSSSIMIFLVIRQLGALTSLPYSLYSAIKWTPKETVNYDPYVLMWLGMSFLIHVQLVSVSTLFLTIDRCLILLLPMRYKSRTIQTKLMPITTIVCLVIWGAISAYYVLIEIPLDVNNMHQCQSLSCVLRKYNLAVPLNGKLVIGFLNICASGLLMYAIRSTKTIHKLKNKVVKMTMFLEITLDMTPVFVNQICVMAGVPVGLYVGQLDTFMTMANVAICSVYYSKILIKRGNGCCVPSKKIVINVTLFNTASLHTRRSVPITSTFKNFYIIIVKSLEAENYHPYMLLWLGVGFLVYIQFISLSALLMTIDRCLALLTPMCYRNRLSKIITIVSVCCLIVWGAISALYVIIELRLGSGEKKVTMITEILLDVMPTFLNQLFFMITEDSLGSYAGQLPTCLSMLNVAICSIHYSRILIRRQDTCCSSSYRVQTVNAWSS